MNKIKVLLIEDDRSISNFITATMDREGYKIMHALNGREGLSLSTSFCPNVILLDLGLPDMDGLEVLQKLRSWSDVPVIIISARTKEQEKVSALDLGADDYITKNLSAPASSWQGSALLCGTATPRLPVMYIRHWIWRLISRND